MLNPQVLVAILDETVKALTDLDLDTLHALERRITVLADQVEPGDEIGLAMPNKDVLEMLLRNCEANLKTLQHLHLRNTRDSWER
jgi:hypothetical protein